MTPHTETVAGVLVILAAFLTVAVACVIVALTDTAHPGTIPTDPHRTHPRRALP